MKAIAMTDIQHPDQPAVVKALTIRCSICHVPAGSFCHAIGVGKKMASLVHMARATHHFDRKGAE